jgi:3-hydroxyisobutyrate dehydrogenase-like beta-hydroxyacid dehydrogenase
LRCEAYGKRIADRDFAPAGFELGLGLKDVDLFLGVGGDEELPLQIASVLRDRFLSAMAEGIHGIDWSAVGRVTKDRNLARKALGV